MGPIQEFTLFKYTYRTGAVCSTWDLMIHNCSQVFGALAVTILLCQVQWSAAFHICQCVVCLMFAEQLDDPRGKGGGRKEGGREYLDDLCQVTCWPCGVVCKIIYGV